MRSLIGFTLAALALCVCVETSNAQVYGQVNGLRSRIVLPQQQTETIVVPLAAYAQPAVQLAAPACANGACQAPQVQLQAAPQIVQQRTVIQSSAYVQPQQFAVVQPQFVQQTAAYLGGATALGVGVNPFLGVGRFGVSPFLEFGVGRRAEFRRRIR